MGPPLLEPLHEPKEDVRLQAALVRLVQHNHAVPEQMSGYISWLKREADIQYCVFGSLGFGWLDWVGWW